MSYDYNRQSKLSKWMIAIGASGALVPVIWIVSIVLVALLWMGANPTANENWNLTYETNPANGDNVSSGDDWFRRLKFDIRKRLEPEIQFGSVTGDDNGLMRVGSARCFVQATAPTNIEQGDFNHTTDGTGTSTLTANATNSAPAEKVGHGRCWLDTDGADNVAGTIDDNTLSVWDSTNGWVAITKSADGPTLFRGPRNLLRNSSFEVGTGSATPDGWTALNTPTLSYTVASPTEGSGQRLGVVAAGGADEGISQTLAGLQASRTYLVVARGNAAGGSTCSLRTLGGTSNVTDTTISTGAFEDLYGTFVVDGAGNTVTVILEANADTNSCSFDRAGVFLIGDSSHHPAVPSASSWLAPQYTLTVDTAGVAASSGYSMVSSQTFTAEAPNCRVFITAQGRYAGGGATGFVTNLRTQVSVNGGAFANTSHPGINANGQISSTSPDIHVAGYHQPLAPGSTYQFQLAGVTSAGAHDIDTTADLNVEMRCPGD